MKKHTKIYLNYFGYSGYEYMPCEICNSKAVDINHIDSRKMGGNPSGDKDVIENLIAVCRKCHLEFGDIKEKKEMMKKIHLKFMHENGRA